MRESENVRARLMGLLSIEHISWGFLTSGLSPEHLRPLSLEKTKT